MKVGDTVEVEIEEIGVLRNPVIEDPGNKPIASIKRPPY